MSSRIEPIWYTVNAFSDLLKTCMLDAQNVTQIIFNCIVWDKLYTGVNDYLYVCYRPGGTTDIRLWTRRNPTWEHYTNAINVHCTNGKLSPLPIHMLWVCRRMACVLALPSDGTSPGSSPHKTKCLTTYLFLLIWPLTYTVLSVAPGYPKRCTAV